MALGDKDVTMAVGKKGSAPVAARLVNNKAFVPLRYVAEALGRAVGCR